MSLFKGAGVALITPFNEDNSVNYEMLRTLVKRQIDGGTDAIIVCGTTGEPATMTEEEKAFGNKMCGRRDSRADSCNSGNRCQLHTKCDRFLTES